MLVNFGGMLHSDQPAASFAHTAKDIDRYLDVLNSFLDEIICR
jgi:hypothetical protein